MTKQRKSDIVYTIIYTKITAVKDIKWNILKSERLKRTRGVSFDEIITAKFIGAKKHPKKDKQNILLFKYKRYVWIVPYVEDKNSIFLKTLYPSRKYTRLYREGKLK